MADYNYIDTVNDISMSSNIFNNFQFVENPVGDIVADPTAQDPTEDNNYQENKMGTTTQTICPICKNGVYYSTTTHTNFCETCYSVVRLLENDEPTENTLVKAILNSNEKNKMREIELDALESVWNGYRMDDFPDEDFNGDLTRKLFFLAKLWLSEEQNYRDTCSYLLRDAASRVFSRTIMDIVNDEIEDDEIYIKAGDDFLEKIKSIEKLEFATLGCEDDSEMEDENYGFESATFPIIEDENPSENAVETEHSSEMEVEDEGYEHNHEEERGEAVSDSSNALNFALAVKEFVENLKELSISEQLERNLIEEKVDLLVDYVARHP